MAHGVDLGDAQPLALPTQHLIDSPGATVIEGPSQMCPDQGLSSFSYPGQAPCFRGQCRNLRKGRPHANTSA